MEYIGEQLLPGQIGRFLIVLGFVSAFLATLSYFFATQRSGTSEERSWRNIGRSAFITHGLSVFGIIGIIFYLMISRRYEYNYVWAHVSDDLPFRYIFSAFWEGQEGSFLLWTFWHVVLGFVLIKTAKKWEAPVMAVVGFVQFFILSMILGVFIYIGGTEIKIGSNPLVLLRDVMDIPLFNRADYVGTYNGTGMSPLLQNYWMTIHPPTLFLGFASTIVPFAFAIAGLWTKKHKEWLTPAMNWSLFSAAILGTGILMGGAWAYEALSFGGYWAWDPVENASLVPWIILLGGIHTNLIAKNTGQSIRSTYLFYLLTFLLIIYSTFLTRSGVLGETSVHAFTEMGLETQLGLFLGTFFTLALFSFFYRYKGIPSPVKEESSMSKEFWIFIGTLVLFFSSILITASTSLPIYNKIAELFNPLHEAQVITDPIEHYNKYQLWIAVFVALLSGAAQYYRFKQVDFDSNKLSALGNQILLGGISVGMLTFVFSNLMTISPALLNAFFGIGAVGILAGYILAYTQFIWHSDKESPRNKTIKKLSIQIYVVALIAALMTFFTTSWIDLYAWQYILLAWSAWFAIISNLDYLVRFARGNLKLAGSAFAHMGFGLLIIGVLASGLNKAHISNNVFEQTGMIEGFSEDDYKKNIMLFKGMPVPMSGYEVTYIKDTIWNFNRTFEVNYKKKDETGNVVEDFNIFPNVIYDKAGKEIAASNPSTKRYLGKDIFNYIASLPKAEVDTEYAKAVEDSLDYQVHEILVGDTIKGTSFYALIEGINRKPSHEKYKFEEGDLPLGIKLKLGDYKSEEKWDAEPVLVFRKNFLYSYPVMVNDLNVKVKLPEQIFEEVYNLEESLDYKDFTFTQNQKINLNQFEITFEDFNTDPEHPDYENEEGDIAVGANIIVKDNTNSNTETASPIYLIRDSRPFNLKDAIPSMGLHFRFIEIDPQSGSIKMSIAIQDIKEQKLSVEIAEKVARSDYIVLQAIVFPGINFFWFGSLMMMFGLLMSMIWRIRQKQAQAE